MSQPKVRLKNGGDLLEVADGGEMRILGAISGMAMKPYGKTYYVARAAEGGSDSNSGLSANKPLLTLQAAIDKCTNAAGDVIFVSRGNHVVTEAVNFNKFGITVVAAGMGLPYKTSGERFTIAAHADYDDGPVAIITKPCTIVGIGFAGRDATKENCLISSTAGGWNGGFIHLLGCRFSCWYGAMAAGLRVMGGDGNRVESCTFEGLFGGFGTAGIVCQNGTEEAVWGPPNMRIINNDFSSVGDGKHAIKTVDTVIGLIVDHNYLSPGFSGHAGKLLDNNNKANTGYVVGNYVGGANKAAAFDNLTNSNLVFAGNHYDDA